MSGVHQAGHGEGPRAARRAIGNHCARPRAQHIVAQVMPLGEGSDVRDPLRLYLIRHVEAAWSLTGQHTGRSDIALTQHGEQQARELEPWLTRIAFVRVLSSPALRARQTCELAAGGCEAEIEPGRSQSHESAGTKIFQRVRDIRGQNVSANAAIRERSGR
jgi:hypothetical protein